MGRVTVEIIFESHATSEDNEAGLASGHFDIDLSPLGERQAADMGRRHAETPLDAVFCSDLRRAYRTAAIAFGGRPLPIIRDIRLRECNYGDLTRHPREEINALALQSITTSYPNGESWQQAVDRVRPLLDELVSRYNGRHVLVIGHRATHYALEHWIAGRPLHALVTTYEPWRPGWYYSLELPLPPSTR